MNERIKKIADDCGLWIEYDNRNVTEKELEFFAEQIIKECYDVVMTGDRYRRDYFADKIKKHFGMEE